MVNEATNLESDTPEPSICYSDLFTGPQSLEQEAPSPFQIDEPETDFDLINRLPNETLCAIFDEGRRSKTAREGSWLISVSHVCRRWREVTIYSPFLWTDIYFGPRLLSPNASKYTQACMQRSQNCPLDVTLRFGDGAPLRDQQIMAAARLADHLHIIIPHINRWRTLDVHVYHHKSLPQLFGLLPGRATNLKQVRIVLERHAGGNFYHEVFRDGTPMLVSVELRGISFALCKFPLAQLTSLTLTRSDRALSPSEFRSVLTSSLSLRDLSLYGDIASPGQEPWPLIQIPSLISLTLSPGSDTLFAHLCTALVVPALESLTFQHFSSESIRIFVESIRPYPTKYPRLRLLELRSVEHQPSSAMTQIVDLLEQSPMITELSLISFGPWTFHPLLKLLLYKDPATMPDTPDHDARRDDGPGRPFDIQANADNKRPDSHVLASQSPEIAERVLLPHLHTIGITPMHEENIAEICGIISTREAGNRAISCLKASSYDGISSDRFQWLREHVRLDNR